MSAVDVLAVPAGMQQVTHDEFWAAVMSETRNIHPRSEKLHTDWQLVNTQQRWGWSSRGYLGPFDYQGAPPEVFALARVGGGA